MKNRPLCFVDTETTSLRDDREVWEVAMIRVDDSDAVPRYKSFCIEIDHLEAADPKALQIGGFWDRHPYGRFVVEGGAEPRFSGNTTMIWGGRDNYLSKDAAARTVAAFTHDAELWGAVPSFDADGLKALLTDFGYLPTWSHRLRCVETLVMGHLREPVNGLTEACNRMGIVHRDEHTAYGDATAAFDVYCAVMGATS